MLRLLRVAGDSMAPTAGAGSLVLALPWPRRWLRVGQLVIARVDADALIIKRLRQVDGDSIVLSSDNPHVESAYCNVPLSLHRIVARAVPLSVARTRSAA